MIRLKYLIFLIFVCSFAQAQKDSTFTYYELNDTFIIKYNSHIDTIEYPRPFTDDIYKQEDIYRNGILINRKRFDVNSNILRSDWNYSNDTAIKYTTYYPEGMIRATWLKISQSESVFFEWYKNGALSRNVRTSEGKNHMKDYFPSGVLASDFYIDFNKNKSFELKSYSEFDGRLESKEYFKSLKFYKGDTADFSKLHSDYKFAGYFPTKSRITYDEKGSIKEKEFYRNGIAYKIYKYSDGKKKVEYFNNQ